MEEDDLNVIMGGASEGSFFFDGVVRYCRGKENKAQRKGTSGV